MLIDGKKVRDELLEQYKYIIDQGKLEIELHIIEVGDNVGSNVYVQNKIKFCDKVGIKTVLHKLDENTSEKDVIVLIEELNKQKNVTGIMVENSLPKTIKYENCIKCIAADKDVEGLTLSNLEALYHNRERVLPCTVKGILKLLEYYNVDLSTKRVAIIGRSDIVGKPLFLALLNRNATVTLCHSKTKNLSEITASSDVIISAVGKPKLIKKDMVKDGFIGIDVGINKDDDGNICGDFDFDCLEEKYSLITKVPGGVGPMTVAMLIDNLIYLKKEKTK